MIQLKHLHVVLIYLAVINVVTLVASDYVGIASGRKMNLITYDPVHHTYIRLGETVGKAFSDGKLLK